MWIPGTLSHPFSSAWRAHFSISCGVGLPIINCVSVCLSVTILILPLYFNRFIEMQFTFPDSLVGKESACNAGDPGSIPGSGRVHGEGLGYPLHCFWTPLETQLVKNPPAKWETWVQFWIGKIPWRMERLPIIVFWSGEFHGLYSPWGRNESDMTEPVSHSLFIPYNPSI